ncbi:MAG: glycosyltransferase, partial [archaeon]|nr:glycosyltransferase [archaeon]
FQKYKNVKSNLIVGERRTDDIFISILIPTFNRTLFLEEAVESAINQTFKIKDYEIIIVDNNPNPTPEIDKMISNKKIENIFYYKNEKNIGMIGNWNRCIELSKGKWITFLHDDDLFTCNYLKQINTFIQKYTSTFLVAPNAQIIQMDVQGNVKKDLALPKDVNKYYKLKVSDFYFGNPTPTQGTLFQREKAIELGGYSEKWFPGMDWVFFINYVNNFGGIKILNNLVVYRKHAGSESLDVNTQRKISSITTTIKLGLLASVNIPKFLLYNYILLEEESKTLKKTDLKKIFFKITTVVLTKFRSFYIHLRMKNQ